MSRALLGLGLVLVSIASAPARGDEEPTHANAISVNLASYPFTALVGDGRQYVEVDYERRLSPVFAFFVSPQLMLVGGWPAVSPMTIALNLGVRLYFASSALGGFFVGAGGGILAIVMEPAQPTFLIDVGYNFTPAPWVIFGVGARFMLLGAPPYLGWPRLTVAIAF